MGTSFGIARFGDALPKGHQVQAGHGSRRQSGRANDGRVIVTSGIEGRHRVIGIRSGCCRSRLVLEDGMRPLGGTDGLAEGLDGLAGLGGFEQGDGAVVELGGRPAVVGVGLVDGVGVQVEAAAGVVGSRLAAASLGIGSGGGSCSGGGHRHYVVVAFFAGRRHEDGR